MLAAFALLAVSMTVSGLYAVSAWIAQQCQREAALRVALGAERASVALVVARRGLVAVATGLVAGWIAAGPLAGLIASELHGVDASDLFTRGVVAVLLVAVSAAALWRPAWRVTAFNLSVLLRAE